MRKSIVKKIIEGSEQTIITGLIASMLMVFYFCKENFGAPDAISKREDQTLRDIRQAVAKEKAISMKTVDVFPALNVARKYEEVPTCADFGLKYAYFLTLSWERAGITETSKDTLVCWQRSKQARVVFTQPAP